MSDVLQFTSSRSTVLNIYEACLGPELELSLALNCSFFLRPNWQSIKRVSFALFATRADAFQIDLATTRSGAQSLTFNSAGHNGGGNSSAIT